MDSSLKSINTSNHLPEDTYTAGLKQIWVLDALSVFFVNIGTSLLSKIHL